MAERSSLKKDRSEQQSNASKDFSTMEQYVNNLVEEGQRLRQGSISSVGSRTVSVREFVRSSGSGTRLSHVNSSSSLASNGRHRDSSVSSAGSKQGILRNSASDASIAVLPDDSANPRSSPALGSSYRSVSFQMGAASNSSSPNNIESEDMERTRGSSTATLNPDVCTSMVSSVYESSLNSPEHRSAADADQTLQAQQETQQPVTVIGSSESGQSRSDDEDEMTSIYDTHFNEKRKAKKERRWVFLIWFNSKRCFMLL